MTKAIAAAPFRARSVARQRLRPRPTISAGEHRAGHAADAAQDSRRRTAAAGGRAPSADGPCTSRPAMMPATAARPPPSSQTTRTTLAHVDADDARQRRVFADARASSGRWRCGSEAGGWQPRSTAATASDRSWSGVARMPPPRRQGDLQRLGVIGRLRREDEFEQAAQRQRRAETRHDHDDHGAALARAAGRTAARRPASASTAGERHGGEQAERQRPAEGERPDRRQETAGNRAEHDLRRPARNRRPRR